ncbi:MAG: hypothetical protein JOZ57_13370 [Abitibacteriaceae bacterium]|nr:hypothetical protein [Abditibacteriaceae bacterium]
MRTNIEDSSLDELQQPLDCTIIQMVKHSIELMQPREINTDTRSYDNRVALWRDLENVTAGWTEKTAILGGHYMLAYRQQSQELVPLLASLVREDAQATKFEREMAYDIGDFPEATFEIALRLVAAGPRLTRSIVLVVNDTHFRRTQKQPRDKDLAALRRSYYYKGEIPSPFVHLLAKYPGLDAEAVFERNDAHRVADSNLPSKTIFFPEYFLQKEFAHWTDILKATGRFKSVGNRSCGLRFVYEYHSGRHEVLADSLEGCGCSGETIALLLNLWQKGVRNLILLIPEECRYSVDPSIEIAMGVLCPFDNAIAVWGDTANGTGEARLNAATFYSPGRSV